MQLAHLVWLPLYCALLPVVSTVALTWFKELNQTARRQRQIDETLRRLTFWSDYRNLYSFDELRTKRADLEIASAADTCSRLYSQPSDSHADLQTVGFIRRVLLLFPIANQNLRPLRLYTYILFLRAASSYLLFSKLGQLTSDIRIATVVMVILGVLTHATVTAFSEQELER